ncbi:MAG: hypothetical protein AAF224_15030 [Pseudomonadota bacterium]
MLKRVLTGIAVVIVLAAVGYLYQYGKPRVVRETGSFAEALTTCTPLEQDYWSADLGRTLKRTVIGPTAEEDGVCAASFEALGAKALRCDLPPDAAAVMAEGLLAQLKDIDFLGRVTAFRMSTENPDPMTVVMNGPHCRVED